MTQPIISLCAAAARPQWWMRLYNSLLQNTVPFEIVFVGPNYPIYPLPENFRFYRSSVKPAQAYEIALRNAKGILKGWTADDADYLYKNCVNSLDSVWQVYNACCEKYKDEKTIISMRQHEDGGDNWRDHRLVHARQDMPMMAPFALMNSKFYDQLGGYDRNFICGQSENDVVMRALEAGGRVEMAMDAHIYIHHSECHGEYTFRKGYPDDRGYLEKCWLTGNTYSKTRLKPLERFDDKDILTITQEPTGGWL